MNSIGIDFEAAPKAKYPNLDSWNTYHMEPIQIGLFSLNSKNSYSSVIKADVHLTDFHKRNTPHLTQDKIQKAKDKCDIADEVTKFLHRECDNGCKMLTYTESDWIWFHKLYYGCKSHGFETQRLGIFDIPLKSNLMWNKPKLNFIDVHALIQLHEPMQKSSLASVVADTFPGTDFKNHDALEDAKAVTLIYRAKRFE